MLNISAYSIVPGFTQQITRHVIILGSIMGPLYLPCNGPLQQHTDEMLSLQ